MVITYLVAVLNNAFLTAGSGEIGILQCKMFKCKCVAGAACTLNRVLVFTDKNDRGGFLWS